MYPISWDKSVVMTIVQIGKDMQNIKCNYCLKNIENFLYLGSKISSYKKVQEEITKRIC
jgi:hypothetical protein